MSDSPADPFDDEGSPGRLAGDIEAIETSIVAADGSWARPDAAIELAEGLAWRPNLVHDNGHVLHIHVTDTLPSHVMRRIEAASAAGRRVEVALELSHLYREEVGRALARHDAHVLLVTFDGDAWATSRPDHVLAVMADEQIPVEADLRRAIAEEVWARLGEGTAWERGKRLEALLAFLLSQIRDMRVRKRNYRTDTEEIDIVLQIDNVSNRCWHNSGVPFVLVEARNRAERTDQKGVSGFATKIKTKRGKAELGLMFSIAGYTGDAGLQEIKIGQSDQIVIALMGPDEIEAWIAADDSDEYLEEVVLAAMLR